MDTYVGIKHCTWGLEGLENYGRLEKQVLGGHIGAFCVGRRMLFRSTVVREQLVRSVEAPD